MKFDVIFFFVFFGGQFSFQSMQRCSLKSPTIGMKTKVNLLKIYNLTEHVHCAPFISKAMNSIDWRQSFFFHLHLSALIASADCYWCWCCCSIDFCDQCRFQVLIFVSDPIWLRRWKVKLLSTMQWRELGDASILHALWQSVICLWIWQYVFCFCFFFYIRWHFFHLLFFRPFFYFFCWFFGIRKCCHGSHSDKNKRRKKLFLISLFISHYVLCDLSVYRWTRKEQLETLSSEYFCIMWTGRT